MTVSPPIKKLLKIPLVILCLAALSLVWLWFGEGGVAGLYSSDAERRAWIERIHKLAEENEALLKEVQLLRSDPDYIESVARRELNLIKPNEFLYRFENDSKETSGESEPSKETAPSDGRKRSPR